MLLALKYKEVFWQQVTFLMVCISCYFSQFAFLNTHQPPQGLHLQKAAGDCPRLLFSPLSYGPEDVTVAPVGSLSPVEMAGAGPTLGPVFKALPPHSGVASTTVMTPSSGGAGRTQDFCPGQPCALILMIRGSPKARENALRPELSHTVPVGISHRWHAARLVSAILGRAAGG